MSNEISNDVLLHSGRSKRYKLFTALLKEHGLIAKATYSTQFSLDTYLYQAVNLAGFRASEDPRFEAGIPDFMNGILNFSIHFNVVHRKVDWRNPKMKSLNSMPVYV